MNNKINDLVKNHIINIPDFPVKGILFRDITTLFLQPEIMQLIVNQLANYALQVGADVIVGPESRGFLFGVPVALAAKLPFVLARKPGKLPRATVSAPCALEYGETEFHIHTDAIAPGAKVLIIDDLLATGGTVNCLQTIIKQLNAQPVAACFCVELLALKGQEKINLPVFSLVQY